MLSHIGTSEFLLYDDGSTDALVDALRPYSAVVRQFSTDALRPWPRTTLLPAHICASSHPLSRAAPPPFEHWCERVDPFPQQLAMMRHATHAVRTPFVAFIDADEYLVSLGEVPLSLWLGALPADVGGVLVTGRVMMTTRATTPILSEPQQMEVEPTLFDEKCIVRRSAMHPATVGFVHEVALADGWHYVRDASFSLMHYRHRAFEERHAKRYVAKNGSSDSAAGPPPKLRKLVEWRAQLETAQARQLYTHYVSGLAYVWRTQRALWRRAHPQRPYGLRRVVVVAEMRSGSTWFAQRMFGARSDVLYLYEPCRATVRVRGKKVGRWFDAGCVHIVRELLDCSTPLATWKLLKQDWNAVKLSTPDAFASYRNFSAMCRSRHVVVKVVRVHDPTRLATDECTVIHLERNASHVEASRRRHGIFTLNVKAGQRAKRAGANLTVQLEEARADPEGTATRLHALTGMVPVSGLECSQPISRPFAACGTARTGAVVRV